MATVGDPPDGSEDAGDSGNSRRAAKAGSNDQIQIQLPDEGIKQLLTAAGIEATFLNHNGKICVCIGEASTVKLSVLFLRALLKYFGATDPAINGEDIGAAGDGNDRGACIRLNTEGFGSTGAFKMLVYSLVSQGIHAYRTYGEVDDNLDDLNPYRRNLIMRSEDVRIMMKIMDNEGFAGELTLGKFTEDLNHEWWGFYYGVLPSHHGDTNSQYQTYRRDANYVQSFLFGIMKTLLRKRDVSEPTKTLLECELVRDRRPGGKVENLDNLWIEDPSAALAFYPFVSNNNIERILKCMDIIDSGIVPDYINRDGDDDVIDKLFASYHPFIGGELKRRGAEFFVCIHRDSLPQLIDLFLTNAIDHLRATVPTLLSEDDHVGPDVFADNKEKRYLVYLFLVQGLLATLALGELTEGPISNDLDLRFATSGEERQSIHDLFRSHEFLPTIGPNTKSTGSWVGYNAMTPYYLGQFLKDNVQLIRNKEVNMNTQSYIIGVMKLLFAKRSRPAVKCLLKYDIWYEVGLGRWQNITPLWESKGFVAKTELMKVAKVLDEIDRVAPNGAAILNDYLQAHFARVGEETKAHLDTLEKDTFLNLDELSDDASDKEMSETERSRLFVDAATPRRESRKMASRETLLLETDRPHGAVDNAEVSTEGNTNDQEALPMEEEDFNAPPVNDDSIDNIDNADDEAEEANSEASNNDDSSGSDRDEQSSEGSGKSDNDSDDEDEFKDVDHLANITASTTKVDLKTSIASRGDWPIVLLAYVSLPFPKTSSQRLKLRGCNQQLVQRAKAEDIAVDMFRSRNEAKEQLTFQPATLMIGAVGNEADNDEEDLVFDAEYGVASGESTVKRHVVECSGPKVLYYVMLSAGSYEEADKYIQETIEKGRIEENWNQDYHDECSKIAEGLAKDIASIESFIEKDKNSEIEGEPLLRDLDRYTGMKRTHYVLRARYDMVIYLSRRRLGSTFPTSMSYNLIGCNIDGQHRGLASWMKTFGLPYGDDSNRSFDVTNPTLRKQMECYHNQGSNVLHADSQILDKVNVTVLHFTRDVDHLRAVSDLNARAAQQSSGQTNFSQLSNMLKDLNAASQAKEIKHHTVESCLMESGGTLEGTLMSVRGAAAFALAKNLTATSLWGREEISKVKTNGDEVTPEKKLEMVVAQIKLLARGYQKDPDCDDDAKFHNAIGHRISYGVHKFEAPKQKSTFTLTKEIRGTLDLASMMALNPSALITFQMALSQDPKMASYNKLELIWAFLRNVASTIAGKQSKGARGTKKLKGVIDSTLDNLPTYKLEAIRNHIFYNALSEITKEFTEVALATKGFTTVEVSNWSAEKSMLVQGYRAYQNDRHNEASAEKRDHMTDTILATAYKNRTEWTSRSNSPPTDVLSLAMATYVSVLREALDAGYLQSDAMKKRIKDLKNEDDWFLFSSSTMRRDQIPTDTDLDDKTCIVGFKSTSDEILYLRKEFRFAAMVRLLIDEPAEEDKNDPNLAQRLWKAKDPGSKAAKRRRSPTPTSKLTTKPTNADNSARQNADDANENQDNSEEQVGGQDQSRRAKRMKSSPRQNEEVVAGDAAQESPPARDTSHSPKMQQVIRYAKALRDGDANPHSNRRKMEEKDTIKDVTVGVMTAAAEELRHDPFRKLSKSDLKKLVQENPNDVVTILTHLNKWRRALAKDLNATAKRIKSPRVKMVTPHSFSELGMYETQDSSQTPTSAGTSDIAVQDQNGDHASPVQNRNLGNDLNNEEAKSNGDEDSPSGI